MTAAVPTYVVTGANSGLGFETARELCARGAHVVLAVRDLARGAAAAGRIAEAGSSSVVQLDLTDLDQVARCADTLLGSYGRLTGLVCNAGIMGGPQLFTAQGFERQMGTNHLGHAALVNALWPLLDASGSRVVMVSSGEARAGELSASTTREQLFNPDPYDGRQIYRNSKQANLLFAQQLHRRLPLLQLPRRRGARLGADPGSTQHPSPPDPHEHTHAKGLAMSHRKIAVVIAGLFFFQLLTFMIGASMVDTYLEGGADRMTLTIGVLFEMAAGLAVVAIGMLMYRVLKPVDRKLALGYPIMRIAEFTVSAVLAVFLLSQLTEFPNHLLWVYIPTAIGGIILNYLFLTSRLIPRSIATLGMVGYVLLLLVVPLDLLGVVEESSGAGLAMLAPGGVYEFVILPLWLIARGFRATRSTMPRTELIGA